MDGDRVDYTYDDPKEDEKMREEPVRENKGRTEACRRLHSVLDMWTLIGRNAQNDITATVDFSLHTELGEVNMTEMNISIREKEEE